MLTNDHLDTLALAHDRGSRLRSDAAAERLRATSVPRRVIAASLRRTAEVLDKAPFARRPATQS